MSTNAVLESYARLRREISLISATRLKAMDIGQKQMQILYKLTQGSCSMSDLADYTQSDKAAITRAIDSLEQAGWIERTSAPGDRRKWLILLTAAGKPKAREAKQLRDDIGESINKTLTASERKEMARLLSKVADGLAEQRT